jgi:murein L,D-transpeptidase YcbB/YkuD
MLSLSIYWPGLRITAATSIIGVCLVLFPGLWAAAQPDARASLVSARLSAAEPLSAAGRLLDKDQLQSFYASRNYELAWDADGAGLGPRATAVVALLSSADADGLDPADYHTTEIAALAGATTDEDRIDRDLLISDGLVHYARDVSGGKLTPSETDERLAAKPGIDVGNLLTTAATADPASLPAVFAALPPASPDYVALKATLAVLRQQIAAGGWQALPDGGTIHAGAHDPAIPALRQRLIAEGLISADAPPPKRTSKTLAAKTLYGSDLVAAVEAYQGEHGIKPDGTIGKDTRAALDMSAEDRLRQVVVNLERARWTLPPPPGRRIEVNLAAYSLAVYQDDRIILAMSVVDGTPENQTPLLSTAVTTVVLNPTWTLPPVVLKELEGHRAGYFAKHGIVRMNDKDGVRFVQGPGPDNPLGRYKFVMPNNQDIYLHDTPDQGKFRFALRNYSHGCVRLDNAPALAALLLDDQVDGTPDALNARLQTGKTHQITLSQPVPVSLVYRTAWLDQNGKLVLGLDPYGRDGLLWAALHPTAPRVGNTAPVTAATSGL